MKIITSILFVLCSILTAFGQSYWDHDEHGLSLKMPEISLVTVMPLNYTVNLSLSLPTSAGGEPGVSDEGRDDNTWLNYSVGRRANASYRKVYAQITSGSIPSGLSLKLEVKNLQSQGRGSCGSRYSEETFLSNQPQVVVTRIGSGCTNRGKSFGHQLIYELKLDDINDLRVKEPTTYLTITYTISD